MQLKVKFIPKYTSAAGRQILEEIRADLNKMPIPKEPSLEEVLFGKPQELDDIVLTH